MASFDDLAFTGPPSANTIAATVRELFCRDCNEVPAATTTDGKRCLVCGCELERRQPSSVGQYVLNSESSVRELQGMVMRLLNEIGGDWNGGDTETRRPASDEAVKNLHAFIANQASTFEVAIIVKGIKGEVIAVPSNFGPCETLKERNVVIGDPFDGAEPFRNANEMQDKIVVMTRGGCTFARKVLRAQAAGAAGVIIIQTADVWPYTMTDSTGESKDVKIPAFMMSLKHGKGFVEYLRGKPDNNISADIIVRKDARECVICQVDMSIGMKMTRMPCQHMFHTDCLHEWLRIGNSCPICRVEIAAKNTAHNNFRTAQQRGDFAWNTGIINWLSSMSTQFFASCAATTGPAFCPHCGSILDHPDTNNIVCSACEYRCRYEDLPSLTVITQSEDKPTPKWLNAEKVMSEVTGPARATVEETCPKCGNPEMEYYTLQLRSADEGQTVFYDCKKCGHKFSVNN